MELGFEMVPPCPVCGEPMSHDGVGWLCGACLERAGVVSLTRRKPEPDEHEDPERGGDEWPTRRRWES